jgi:hypothetical protein
MAVGATNIGGMGSMKPYIWGYLPIFFMASDYFLIGPEVHASSAAISRDAAQTGCIVAADIIQIAAMLIMGIGFVLYAGGMTIF